MYKVQIDNEVYLQLLKIKKYYELNNFDLTKLKKIHNKLYKTIASLERFPHLGNKVNFDNNYRKIIVEKYIVIYRVEEENQCM